MIRGTKIWITNARYADPLPVLVKTDPEASPPHRGMSVLLVEAGTPGFSVSRDLPKMGYKGPESCEVVLDDVRVPVTNLLGEVEGRGLAAGTGGPGDSGVSISPPGGWVSPRRPTTKPWNTAVNVSPSVNRSRSSKPSSSSWPRWPPRCRRPAY